MDVGARSLCGSLLLGVRHVGTNLLRCFVDGYVVHRRLAQMRTYLSRSGSTPSFETCVSYSDLNLLMVRLLVGI